jgi:TPR repeat protein
MPNRRRRVRHRVQTPAYATFTGESKSAMLDLHEIVDISEDGVSIHCHSPLEVNRRINLCLDLAECSEHIYTTGQVVWANPSGRAGLRFSGLAPVSLLRLREWLFLNAMSGLANADEAALVPPADANPSPAPRAHPNPSLAAETIAPASSEAVPPSPGYTDTLAALTAVQREVEALGADLAEALRLIANRTHTLVRSSGAAIALADSDPEFMVCRASSGDDAPPVGARLQVGSGFSGECVKTGRLLRCEDAETDARVDRTSCRALGIRSILAAPVRVGEKSIGIVEAFSPQPDAFTENDSTVLQRLADTVLAAVNRAARAENLPLPGASAPIPFKPTPGSVLFASVPEAKDKDKVADENEDETEGTTSTGITLPRSHLILLVCTAATIFLVLGYHSGRYVVPWIQGKLQQRNTQLPTVLASSPDPIKDPKVDPKKDAKSSVASLSPIVETASFVQLQQMAQNGDPAAENALGLRYSQGDPQNRIQPDDREAFNWFSRAAQDGSLAAQSKLGFLYSTGRGVPKDINQAYFWAVLARARGDQGNKNLAIVLGAGMPRAQAAAIEQQADGWLQQHESHTKPTAGR